MKKIKLLALFFLITIKSFCQPQVSNPSFPSSVDLFDLFEVSFNLNTSYSNPYDSTNIMVYAVFTSPDNTSYQVNAFYYEGYSFYQQDGYEHAVLDPTNLGYCWRIRFTPTCIGNWNFRIFAEDANGNTQMPNNDTYTFTCTSVANSKGFISMANSRFMKRDAVINGQRRYNSFFPIGPNVAWYNNKDNNTTQPLGIYQYEDYIDSLYNNCNYMRIWLTRYQHLSLYGPEYTQMESGHPKVYFDSILNQKDSAELDYIITYAAQHGIAVMPCILTYGDFQNMNMDPSSKTKWDNNPFNTVLHLENPCEFFTNKKAKTITKNLFRYIVARWGYATNIMSWEFWNEIDNMFYMCDGNKHIEQDVLAWHEEMAAYIRSIDPFNHCVSTSMGSKIDFPYLYSHLFGVLDFVQEHLYENIQNAESKRQLLYCLYKGVVTGHTKYPSTPFFFGEFGFGQRPGNPTYADKDPFGIDLHNSLWASLFSTSMGPASFWQWPHVNSNGLYRRFKPLLIFCQNLPVPSSTFIPAHTGHEYDCVLAFPNNIQTYYMINASQDTIYGWSQDTAFAYQSLRWLTDSTFMDSTHWGLIRRFKQDTVYDPLGYVYTLNQTKKPIPSYNSNTITLPITNQPVGSRYQVRWYNTETGNLHGSVPITYAIVQQDSHGNKFISFQFPSQIRNLQQHTINNTFGDAVFIAVVNNPLNK